MKAVNLLPNDLRGSSRASADTSLAQPEPGGPGAFVVLGVLAFCLVALAGYVLTTNTVKERQSQLAAVTAEAQAATQRATELKPYADFDTLAKARIQTVRDLAASRFDWEQSLRDVSRAIPAAVTLASLNGSVSGGSGGGGALRSAIAAPAIELSGCTSSQPAVAQLMSRLRAVDGVTRVSLSKSTKPNAGGATSTSSDQPPCGKADAPQFELVIFFERSEVPATVEDITVAPQAVAEGAAPEGAPASGAEPATTPPATENPAAGSDTPESTPASTEDSTS
jgi:Tfp pilus assembly protein PilN